MGSTSSKRRSSKRMSKSRVLKRSRKSRLSKSSRKRVLKSKSKSMKRMPRMTVMTTPMFRSRVPIAGVDYASVYVPGSEKGRRLTRKGGFTEYQVRNQVLGIGPLRKGKLSGFGYSTFEPKTSRAKSLGKAVKEYGALSTYRSLNAIAVYNKNTNPEVASVAKADRDMIRTKYM